MNKNAPATSELTQIIMELSGDFRRAFFFSAFINLLALAPIVYMMQVYGRVIYSRNITTLAMLTLMAVALYLVSSLLELIRTEILFVAGLKFDAKLGERAFNLAFDAGLRRVPGGAGHVLSDLRVLQDFFISSALVALFDFPLSLLFIILIYLINPILGHFAIFGALVQFLITYIQERRTNPPLQQASTAMMSAQGYANGALRNAQAIEAMGMLPAIRKRWVERQQEFLRLQATASANAGLGITLAKFVQMMQGSLMMAMGCWLSLMGILTGNGALMIIASILSGRAVQPMMQLIMQWKLVSGAIDAYKRLDKSLQDLPARPVSMPLPPPQGHLMVEGIIAGAPGNSMPILRGLNFKVSPGEVMAIIGPSGSGKSSLARVLIGVWPTLSGKVRLDGVDIYQWRKTELGPHLGYLPQDVALFEGTVAENIARFGHVDYMQVEAAAKLVGLHECLMELPYGYETRIGREGGFLSGGQRQRVALARAIYGNPRLVILDEPNASLDHAGDLALTQVLLTLKAAGVAVIVISHLTSILQAVDSMLVLQDGMIKLYGSRSDVLAVLYPATAVPKVKGEPVALLGNG